ncbi:hypothetical protein PV04_04804 [Phialophora macrospora]|uniref:Rad51-like C-terminal domain-containing protein n=1 Tax=Phialophora macrospora TaxID=1851006 RepID=A0A0D2FQR1_9EURO|nr:hypothetical protein PV04_04804 [Phialophora macrospora]
MAAEHYGARLLEEVQEESLEKFLAELRHIICPQPKSVFGVPQLDRLLEAVRYPAGSTTPPRPAWQSQDLRGSESEDQHDSDIGPREQHVEAASSTSKAKAQPATIELTSQTTASGKTALLSYLAGVSVLPRHVGGKESTVVYIDADGHFSAMRLKQIMYHYIQQHQHQHQHQHSNQQANNPGTTSLSIPEVDMDVDAIIQDALHHVHVFRPQSSSHILSIVSNLQAYLFDTSRGQSIQIHRPLGLVILDPATAFYWQDRFDRAMARLDTPGVGIQAQGPSMTLQIIDRLKNLQTRFECAVLFSTTMPSTHPPAPTRRAEAGPLIPAAPPDTGRGISPWTAYATLALLLARTPVAQFPPQMSMDECVSARETRFEAMRQGRFTAVVQSMHADGGQGGGSAAGRTTGFRFNITDRGVEVDWMPE